MLGCVFSPIFSFTSSTRKDLFPLFLSFTKLQWDKCWLHFCFLSLSYVVIIVNPWGWQPGKDLPRRAGQGRGWVLKITPRCVWRAPRHSVNTTFLGEPRTPFIDPSPSETSLFTRPGTLGTRGTGVHGDFSHLVRRPWRSKKCNHLSIFIWGEKCILVADATQQDLIHWENPGYVIAGSLSLLRHGLLSNSCKVIWTKLSQSFTSSLKGNIILNGSCTVIWSYCKLEWFLKLCTCDPNGTFYIIYEVISW